MKEFSFAAMIMAVSLLAAYLWISLTSCSGAKTISYQQDGKACTAELDDNGKPTKIDCEIVDGGAQ